MTLNFTVDDVLTTTRSVRKRLDLQRPVSREVVMECLELALQAPTGSNGQGWQWVFVDDPAGKQALAEIYAKNFAWYRDLGRPEYPEDDVRGERADAVADSAQYLADHLHEVPILLVPCLQGRVDGEPTGVCASFWGSLLPAVWSFMLALRSRGLGSAWTTLHMVRGGEERAAELLGIPFHEYTQGGLFPIAYTKGTEFRPAKRLPAQQLTHWNTW